MKIIIKERSNQDWVLHELQVAYQAKSHEVDAWIIAHDAFTVSNKFAELTFQSELSAVWTKAKDWKRTYQELAKAQMVKEEEFKEVLATLE